MILDDSVWMGVLLYDSVCVCGVVVCSVWQHGGYVYGMCGACGAWFGGVV